MTLFILQVFVNEYQHQLFDFQYRSRTDIIPIDSAAGEIEQFGLLSVSGILWNVDSFLLITDIIPIVR
jgi:hypothetical protein